MIRIVVLMTLLSASFTSCTEMTTVIEGHLTRFECQSKTEPIWEQKIRNIDNNLAFGAKKFPNFKNDR